MTPRNTRQTGAVAALAAAALTLTACGGTPAASSGTPAADGKLAVVASTNVWADVARAVGGDAVSVKAVVGATGDPHSYESTAVDAATVRGAALVVFNGGHYDDFMPQIIKNETGKPVVEAMKVAGQDEHAKPETAEAGHEHANEHLWYDLDVVEDVAKAIAAKLGELKADAKDRFTANAQAFTAKIDALEQKVDAIKAAHTGVKVTATEPIAHYLLDEAGLADVTPAQFSKAVEEENDPPAVAIAEIQKLVTERTARVLVYNPQTESPVTKQVKENAVKANVAVVELTETLPEGKDYTQWMGEQIDKLAAALKK
ncbi:MULTISPECIES: metal ABC transporter solute-binding protein, Zn/Mn family [unclassified Crossiella]|uniref:metal ABC transporter solute-binding protein, Zn/Mn family n=1 Tax=unclassified Crossiella TaxID=2620835 RepID=UPI001FFF6C52|nr:MULTISPECIES: zinc ABC transporter substrate-binding protein [unclassified Crossiella]MCK2237840.1 zinc ABC transporter substrate-binding protein [Crossiella sp. S99.2]MCK2255126.1 zinc ABC transporter substrate-binding protein [Crossiella sp. S99.1]